MSALGGKADIEWAMNATATLLRRVQSLSRPAIKSCNVSGRC
jgi:hypothetical protein